jgi:transposase
VARELIPEDLAPALLPLLDTLTQLTARIRAYDKKIRELCDKSYPETAQLRQVTGVGPITGLAFVLTLEDPGRFKKSRIVGAFVGLVPRKDQSGDRDPELPITKAGDPMLRQLLVQSAHYVLGPFGPDCDLQRFGKRLESRGGKNAKKRAVVAVARKLAVLLHSLWKTGEEYEPLRHHPQLQRSA